MFAPERQRCLSSQRQRGFTLVELTVGLMVSLLIGLAALGTAQFGLAMQRQSAGAGTALGDATTALAALKHELSQAGMGLFVDGALLCTSLNLSTGAAVQASSAPLLPLSLSLAADGTAVVETAFATTLTASAPAKTSAATLLSTGAVELESYLPVSVQQSVLLAPPTGAAGAGQPCSVRTVTSMTAASNGQPLALVFANSGKHNQASFSDVSYPLGSRVALLGALQSTRFRVIGSDLVMERPFDGASAVMAKNVVAFRAQYGTRDATEAPVQDWRDPVDGWAALDATQIGQVAAVRVGILVRSPQRERPAPGAACATTTTPPTLLGSAVDMTAVPDWQCFRYRSATAVVPLRNVITGVSP